MSGVSGVNEGGIGTARRVSPVGQRSTPAAHERRWAIELAVATELARQAGAVLRHYRAAGPLEVRQKARGECVTAADLASNALIQDGLRRRFPGDAIYSEETQDSPARLSRRHVWIVDPLDSTSSYIAGHDEYSLSIGLAVDGRPVLGVVYNPARDELVAGSLDQGVTLNGVAVRTSQVADLASARLTVSSKEWRRGLADWAGGLVVTPIASMAYKLARVAAGLDDGLFSIKPRKEWGTCAGVALVLAAGGRATLLDGAAVGFNRPQLTQGPGLVAAGPQLHPQLLTWLSQHQPRTS